MRNGRKGNGEPSKKPKIMATQPLLALLFADHFLRTSEFTPSATGMWLVIVLIGLAGHLVHARLESVFAKYSKIEFPGGLTGAEVAEKMLRDNRIHDVKVTHVKGQLTDHYNPLTKTVNLSESVYASRSVAAAAVAAHECGHAIQHAQEYAPLKLRSQLVPLVNYSSKLAMGLILVGLVIMATTSNELLCWIGVSMVGLSALFSIVTLPVEYNASARALAWLDGSRTLSGAQLAQAKEALAWAARTYLVAALSAVAALLYYVLVIVGNRR